MIELQLFGVVYFLLSNQCFYTYFQLSPLLDHHWSLKRRDCSISQLKNWFFRKVIWDFSLLWGHFPTQKVYIPRSLTSQKCWCLNKKSYKEEMISSFLTVIQPYDGNTSLLRNFQPIEWQHLQSILQSCAVIGWKMRRRQLEFRCTAVRL